LEKLEAIVVATAVLHNIAIFMSDEVPQVNEEELAAIKLTENVNVRRVLEENRNFNENNILRHLIFSKFLNFYLLFTVNNSLRIQNKCKHSAVTDMICKLNFKQIKTSSSPEVLATVPRTLAAFPLWIAILILCWK
jgi:hypothetical protein